MRGYLGDKQFYRNTLLIALPIMAQQFITTFVSLIDNIMIGSVGNVALTSVTVANRFYLIFHSTLFGICGSAGIYMAQYYGANEKRKCQEVFNINLLWTSMVAIIFGMMLIFIPDTVIRIFSDTPEIISEGLRYIAYTKYAYLPYAISFTCMSALRAVGINNIQLKIGAIAVAINTVLNYCMIFGNFGFPKMGVEGAALATAIVRIMEMLIYITILYRKRHFFSFDIYGMRHLNMNVMRGMFVKAIPLTVNEVLFSVGQAAVFKSYVRTDEYLVSALAVADTVANILFVVFAGLSSAVSILIGKALGANKIEEAKDNAKKLVLFGFMIALSLGTISFLLANFIPEFYNLPKNVKSVITILLRIKSIMIVIHAINVCVFFILRAGGDVVSTLIMDSGFLWIGGVLVSTILSVFTGITLIPLYILIEGLDFIKLFVSSYFFKKEHWAKNIVIE